MKSTPRFLCALLAISLMLTLCACGREAQKKSAADVPPAQADLVSGQASTVFAPSTGFISAEDAGAYVYAQLPLAGYRVHAVLPADGDLVYVIATRCNANGRFLIGEDGVIPTQIVQYDLEAQQKTDFCYQPALDGARDAAISAATLGADGSLWCLACRFRRDEETLVKDFTLERVDADGTVSESIPLDCPEVRSDPELYVNSDGSFLLYTPEDGSLTVYDASGQQTEQQSVDLLTGLLTAGADGRAWFCTDSENGAALQAVGNEKQIPISGVTNGLPTLCYGTDAPDVLYATDALTLYRLSSETGAAEKLADLSVLGVRGGQRFSRTANGCFVFTDTSADIPVLAALCPSSSDGGQKTVLTLATVTPDSEVLAQVRSFNRSSANYHVELLDFSALLDSGSYADVFTVWNTAIMAGDTPDMIDLSNLPWHSFADRGLLLDLNTLLPQEAILPWLWDVLSYHGGNYTFPGCFTVETLAGKQSRLGNKSSWSVTEFLELAEASDIPMFSGMSHELFLFYMEQYFLDAFWDEEAGTCRFDSEEFQALLDYANTLTAPEELGYDLEDTILLIRRDLALAEPVTLRSVSQLHRIESYTVGEPVAWIGWPGENGTKLRPAAELAAFKDTAHPDGVSEFLQFLLSEPCQTAFSRFAFPMTVSALESEITAAMAPRNTNDSDIAAEFTVDGTVYPIIPLSAKDAARYETFFERISAQVYSSQQIEAILEAECAALWAGKKTAAEAAAQIQRRVELYLAENAS